MTFPICTVEETISNMKIKDIALQNHSEKLLTFLNLDISILHVEIDFVSNLVDSRKPKIPE